MSVTRKPTTLSFFAPFMETPSTTIRLHSDRSCPTVVECLQSLMSLQRFEQVVREPWLSDSPSLLSRLGRNSWSCCCRPPWKYTGSLGVRRPGRLLSCFPSTRTSWSPATPSSSTSTPRTLQGWTGLGARAGCWPLLTAPACSLRTGSGTWPVSATPGTPVVESSVFTRPTRQVSGWEGSCEKYQWRHCQAVSSLSGAELPSSWTPTPSSTKWRKWSQARLTGFASGLICRPNVSWRLRSEVRASAGSSKTRRQEPWLLRCERRTSGSACPASFTSSTTWLRLREWRVKRGDWQQNTLLTSWRRISRGNPGSPQLESGWNCLTWRLSWSASTFCLTLRPRLTLRQFGKIIWTYKLHISLLFPK